MVVVLCVCGWSGPSDAWPAQSILLWIGPPCPPLGARLYLREQGSHWVVMDKGGLIMTVLDSYYVLPVRLCQKNILGFRFGW